MSQTITPSDERYSDIIQALAATPGVTQAEGMFRASGQLRVNNRIFAMLVNGKLVVKLPRDRVDGIIAAGEGVRFDPGHGRIMKEWLTVGMSSREDWMSLAREALAFVGAK